MSSVTTGSPREVLAGLIVAVTGVVKVWPRIVPVAVPEAVTTPVEASRVDVVKLIPLRTIGTWMVPREEVDVARIWAVGAARP